ncbi:MAG: hypothetical protein IPG50_10710 [Myxococcales bacterium]|nr:hypothetical protein [Myxococcales bacterium]
MGASKRFLTSAFVQPRVGPAAQLVGHIALLPLLRLGAYGGYEVSPVGDGPARRIVSLGVRGKVDAPWGSRVLHGYAFVGGGFASVYGPSATVTLRSAGIGGGAPVTESATLPGASGALLEIPLGVGLAVRLRRPWELLFELSGQGLFRFGRRSLRRAHCDVTGSGTADLGPHRQRPLRTSLDRRSGHRPVTGGRRAEGPPRNAASDGIPRRIPRSRGHLLVLSIGLRNGGLARLPPRHFRLLPP